jgi:Fe-S oxidoreductase
MATYKAEFLYHHYKWRRRPASHYSMGYLPWLARWAALAPDLANRAAGTGMARKLAGVAAERPLPRFARQTFRRWFRARPRGLTRGQRVVLWPDTFTNHLTPEVGQAAVEVLESAGFDVVLPDRPVCCGLTWISTGQLGVARRVARRSIARMAKYLDDGTPVVGLEPSCTAALRSEVLELVGSDAARELAARTQTLAEFLVAQRWEPPTLSGQVLVQAHCHQRADLGTAADTELIDKAGLQRLPIEPGCCGMAGNFGFEHYDVAQAVGERAILPAVRAAPPEAIVLADGFSCRTQIVQSTGREALHLAQLLARPHEPETEG